MIAVIDPSIKRPEIEGFNLLSNLCPQKLTYHIPALLGFESLDTCEKNINGIVVMGSRSSVNDKLKWQEKLIAWLFKNIKRKIPILGICFGHQLLAYMFGGKVDFMEKPVIRFNRIELLSNKLWKKRKIGKLFAAHKEEVKTLPKDMLVIGKREGILFEALCHKKLPIWSIQSHIEATPSFVKMRNILHYSLKDFEFGYSILRAFFRFCGRTQNFFY